MSNYDKPQTYTKEEEDFFKEQFRLKCIIYDEINLFKEHKATDVICSLEMLSNILYIIDDFFEEILDKTSNVSILEKQRKLKLFKESLIFTVYGQ